MSKIIFNEHQHWVLEANPNLSSVSNWTNQYKPEFKIHAVKKSLEGKGPAQIFRENGFDLPVIDTRKATSSLNCWRMTF